MPSQFRSAAARLAQSAWVVPFQTSTASAARARTLAAGGRNASPSKAAIASRLAVIAAALARAGVPQRQIAIQMLHAGIYREELPVVGVLLVQRRILEAPILHGTRPRLIHTAQGVDDVLEALEVRPRPAVD